MSSTLSYLTNIESHMHVLKPEAIKDTQKNIQNVLTNIKKIIYIYLYLYIYIYIFIYIDKQVTQKVARRYRFKANTSPSP